MADQNKAAAKAAKKEQRAAKRTQRKQNYKQVWQAFNIQRKQDKALVPLMLAAVVGLALVFFLIGLLFRGQWFMLILGIGLGLVLAMWIFSRRIESTMYDKAADTPGAAGWALENMRNTVGVVWFTKTAVAATTHMDAVHRVIGVPGIILVGEGHRHRVRPLMEQQKKRLNRLVGGVPIYEIYAGDGDDEVPLKKLQRELLKLPRNYKKDDVYPINARVEAMDASGPGAGQAGLPKGPIPKGAKMSGMNRRARRTAERSKKN
ncbi:DUF4191 domain-containing protein [Corynebacterium uberis]|uniref:DUF4191 domain-containing protein n=1 Tax=Corynebacterium TaxID=1716 RepID=UPI001D0A0D9E|nr:MULTISPECIES: DUF4191 domain-containing protein [Corynebacterium]MCZ9308262.1 DUF4191 domain-containing protein [Corynebacterium sp. c6VSa_13]UDL73942.1 DUF4191 domain-containing protein [Corynebacterium uberis]UDL75175.1 DUF4191 domain-containing protein [Corynebacterium uberis]UDL77386.1 DUF4191 domain-containing protein [Corynebacterium uberis]UDL79671.1 DUF4191 domain-containing protein [Corynebacterium uberis]